MAIEAIEDVLFAFGFRARSYSELNLSGDMLGVNERAEGNGDGFKSAKAVKGDEGAGKKEEEEEDGKDKEWKPADEVKRVPYTKNKWFLVAKWHYVDMEEALRLAAEIMIRKTLTMREDHYWIMASQRGGRLDHMVLGM